LLPVSFAYDKKKAPALRSFGTSGIGSISGAVMHVWRAQGWYVNMFEIEQHDAFVSKMTFASQNGHVKGGWQGGRGWHKNSKHASDAAKPGFLSAGKWMIEGA
jgi:hypothetical protein